MRCTPRIATLADAASALAQDLDTNGCKQSAQANVRAFQTAYNNAGGSPTLVVDGLYGANTAAALQNALNGPVVGGCVAAASSGGGGGGSSTPTSGGGSTTPAVNVSTSSNSDLLPIAIAGVAAAGLVGLAIYAKKKRGYVFRRRHPHPHHR